MAFGMGAWCRDLNPMATINGVPANHVELADQANSTAVQTLGVKAKYFRAVVYVKTVLAGAASVSFLMQAAPVQTLGPSVQHIDSRTFSGSAGSYSFILEGFAPDATQGGLGFMRVEVVPTTGSWTFDCILDGL